MAAKDVKDVKYSLAEMFAGGGGRWPPRKGCQCRSVVHPEMPELEDIFTDFHKTSYVICSV